MSNPSKDDFAVFGIGHAENDSMLTCHEVRVLRGANGVYSSPGSRGVTVL